MTASERYARPTIWCCHLALVAFGSGDAQASGHCLYQRYSGREPHATAARRRILVTGSGHECFQESMPALQDCHAQRLMRDEPCCNDGPVRDVQSRRGGPMHL